MGKEMMMGKEVILVAIRKMYDDEMKNLVKDNTHVLPASLLEHHNKSIGIVLGKCPVEDHVEYKAVMEKLFKKYETQNVINLNSGRVAITPAIGIDLGTTYCCVAVHHQGRVIIIPNQKHGGELTTPSYVAFDKDGFAIVGAAAKETASENPESTIFDAKRIIGRGIDDEKLKSDMEGWPFTVIGEDGKPKIQLPNGRLLYPEQVSAELLKECRQIAEDFLKLPSGTIKKAVITVPAYFEDGQRQATLNAGKLAGLEILGLLNEPTAAAIAYSRESLDTDPRKVLIFDMGGGTFDVAVLDVKVGEIEVLGVSGDTHLGGEDFDRKLMKYCAEDVKKKYRTDLFVRKGAAKKKDIAKRIKRVLGKCESAKKILSCGRDATIFVENVTRKLNLNVVVTRDKFEELIDDHFKRSIEIVDAALVKAGVSKEEIDDVVLVGGSTRIPRLQQLVSEYFGGKVLDKSIHPDHAVAYGAAVQAAILNGEKTRGELGQGNLRIQDVTPFSLGVKVFHGSMSVILPKNSKIPARKTLPYSTATDYQNQIRLDVFQGEDFQVARNNKLLGEFLLKNIPPALKGKEAVDVAMEMTDMGILEVTAVIRSTNGRHKIIIGEDRLGMSKEEVNRLLLSM